jgi:acetyl-CoA synthetase
MGADAFLAARDFLLAHRDDYARAWRDFRWPALTEFNWALDFFDREAAGNERPALRLLEEDGNEVRCSFESLRLRSNRAANFLRALGVRRGERILLMLPNTLALWDLMLAAMKLGAVISPAAAALTPEDLRDRIVRGGIRYVAADGVSAPKFDGLEGFVRILVGSERAGWTSYEEAAQASDAFLPDGVTRADDPLLLYFTSGTTARPKMVLHTHRSYPVGHLSTMYWLGVRAGDVHWNISSPGWAKHAWSCFFGPWNAGATVFIFNQARFSAARTLEVIAQHGVTSLCAPPTAWRALILEPLADYRVKLREALSAGEPLNPEVIAQVQAAWGITIRDGYGQTETSCLIGNPPGQPVRRGSMGRPMPGFEIALLDPDGRPAEHGEASVRLRPQRPAGIMHGYDGDAERTREKLGGDYYGTSDVARADAEGYYWFIGRTDDVFKSSDYRISPFELESLLIEHAAVAEAAVVPSPDPRKLAVPKAFVVLKSGFVPDAEVARDILAFVAARTPPYKRIRRLQFADLPKTISGKIRRVELRQAEAARDPATRAPREYWEEDLRQESV